MTEKEAQHIDENATYRQRLRAKNSFLKQANLLKKNNTYEIAGTDSSITRAISGNILW